MLETASGSRSEPVTIRRRLREGDSEALVDMHATIYAAEHGLGGTFAADVARELGGAIRRGWPERGGAAWIVERAGEVAGSLALVAADDGTARVRWFLLEPRLRGRGLGRRLLADLVAEADAAGYELVRLDTFSELRAAAHLYRSFGFEVVDAYRDARWGPPLLLQTYERRAG